MNTSLITDFVSIFHIILFVLSRFVTHSSTTNLFTVRLIDVALKAGYVEGVIEKLGKNPNISIKSNLLLFLFLKCENVLHHK